MRSCRRRKRKIALILLLLIVLSLGFWVHLSVFPLLRKVAENQVVNAASGAITQAMNEELKSGSVDFDHIILLEKDTSGAVTALQTNVRQVALLKSEVFAVMDTLIDEVDMRTLSVPVGNLLFPSFFSGLGPGIPIRVVSLTTTNADFYSEFTSAGINQTLEQIRLQFSVNISFLTPAGMQDTTVSSDVILAETVLLGAVPEAYLPLNN